MALKENKVDMRIECEGGETLSQSGWRKLLWGSAILNKDLKEVREQVM